MNKRINWIDVAKGILIILVVFGHSDITKISAALINSFHMSGFFFLSGMTFSYKSDFFVFLKKKFFSLLIPYAAFATLLLGFQFAKSIVFGGASFNLLSGIISFFVPISGRTTTTVYGLWFLPCLFLTELILYVYFIIRKKYKVLSVIFLVLIFTTSISVYLTTNIASILSILPISLFFCSLGYIFKKYDFISKTKKFLSLFLALILFVIFVFINIYISKNSFDLSSMNLGFWPLYILSGIAGTIFICTLAMFIDNSKFLQMMGKNSLYFYGLHYLIIGIVERFINVKWGGILQTVITFSVLIPIVLIYQKFKSFIFNRRKYE